MKSIKQNSFWSKILFFAIGLGSLIWFLIRVVPKPSRAFYPCQRAAFPMASSFVIWIIATFSGIFSLTQIRNRAFNSQKGIALLFVLLAIVSFTTSWFIIPNQNVLANKNEVLVVPKVKSFLPNDTAWINPQETVAIVKSSKETSDDITEAEIEQMVREAITKAGGFNELVTDGKTVVIKPNLVGRIEYSGGGARRFSEFNNGIVTNWRVIKAIVTMVRENNPNGKVYILEGSADGGTTREMFEYFGYNHENIPGVTEFICLEERSGAYEEWASDSLQAVTIPSNKALYANNLKPNNSDEFYLNSIYYNADVVISVPMLKNHSMTSVTGAVKNVGIGATPATIYAGQNDIHRYFQDRINHQNTNGYENLHKFIHDFYLCRPVDYVIMDGLQGTDYGPVASHPSSFEAAKKNMGLILAGKEAVSVDAIASLLMGYNPAKVKHLVYLHNDTVGTINPKLIKVISPRFQSLKKSFNHNESTLPKYSDFKTPEINISNYAINNNKLSFSLESDDEISKVEIKINGVEISEVCVANFNNIEYDLSNFDISNDTSIVIYAYDEYLNCKAFAGNGSLVNNVLKKELLKIKTYPNPTTSNLNINISDEYMGLVNLNMYNTSGKLIYQKQFNKTNIDQVFTIDVCNLEEGLFVLEIKTDKTKQLLRFLKN